MNTNDAIAQFRKAAQYALNGDPVRDVMDDAAIAEGIVLLVQMVDLLKAARDASFKALMSREVVATTGDGMMLMADAIRLLQDAGSHLPQKSADVLRSSDDPLREPIDGPSPGVSVGPEE